MSIDTPAPGFTMYTTSWCGFCARLKRDLAGAGIAYAEIDIERDPTGVPIVEQANHGNHTVPTLVFADGTTLTNPTVGEVQAKLAG